MIDSLAGKKHPAQAICKAGEPDSGGAMFERSYVQTVANRLQEPRTLIQIIMGPRQTGKSTSAAQVLSHLDLPSVEYSFDRPRDRNLAKLEEVWSHARRTASHSGSTILLLDELQNIPQWSSGVKSLWDEDTRQNRDVRVLITGSSALMLKSRLAESLMGRFEVTYSTHWDLWECMQAFDYTLDDFLYFGGYPGAAPRRTDETRWFDYLTNSIIEPTLNKDALELEPIRKPALLRALFELGAAFSGQEISYRKLLGQLDDRGNTETMAHYLELLSEAGLLSGLKKFSPRLLETKTSSPRMLVHDTSLMVAASGEDRSALLGNPDRYGHLVESAIGAYLLARSRKEHFDLFWWRDGSAEVDFVIRKGRRRTALEVKSGRPKRTKGLGAFVNRYPGTYGLIIDSAEFPVEDFLLGKVPLFQ